MELGSLQAGTKDRRKQQGLLIDGVWVEFPFEPYDCQVRHPDPCLHPQIHLMP